ncbi:MAG: hypothetical protein IJX78_05460 [Bacilli bacterium]|nr:hypothetical protein [Bacilli bacterium]
MSVVIKEVLKRSDLKKWVDFPNKLYKGNKYYVPFLFNDEMDTFTKEKNPAYEFCDTKLFLAYKDGKIVGRIGALVNHAYNKKWGKNAIRFTRFDFIDDYEVSAALFNEVVKWGKEQGFVEAMGPIGFTDMDHEGMLIEGFEELNMSITFYNHPYYIEHMERLGLRKDVDWVEYQLLVPEARDERMKKISEHIQKRNGYRAVFYNDRKNLHKEALEAFKLIDAEFAKLYGTVPLTDKVIAKAIADYIPLVNLKYICTIKDKENKIVGFAVLVPSIAKALKKSNGRMLPFGIFRMLKALKGKNDTLEMFFVAVDAEHQKKGLPAIIIDQMLQMCIDNNVKICETGPELELNEAVQSMWKTFNTRQHRRRRCWIKEI